MWKDGEPVWIQAPELPTITSDLEDSTYIWEGTSYTLYVTAASPDEGILTYQWKKNGIDIEGATKSTLTIENASAADAGQYQVMVRNENSKGGQSDPVSSNSCAVEIRSFQELTVNSNGYGGDWTKETVTFVLSNGMVSGLKGYEYFFSNENAAPDADSLDWHTCEGAGQDTVIFDEETDGYCWFRAKSRDGLTGTAEGPIRVRIDRTVPIMGQPVVVENSITENTVIFTLAADDTASGIGAIRYLVRKASDAVPTAEEMGSGLLYNGNSAQISDLEANTEYMIYGAALDAAGNWSAIVSTGITTTPGAGVPSDTGNESIHDSSSSDSILSSLPPNYHGGTQVVDNIRLPDYVVVGTWTQTTNGWTFTDRSGTVYKNTWGAIYNPSTNVKGGQNAFDWFRFDENGIMITGWYTDTDGNVYCFSPESDGRQGAMVTGWVLIDRKWYYFNEQPDGTRGCLLRDTDTPDGYHVDINGVRI